MKRIMTLLIAAGLVLGASAGSAKAVELTANGTWQFGWSWMQAVSSPNSKDTKDTFKAKQRLRTQFNFIASEDLKGVLFTEIGNGDWGGKDGWATGTDGKQIKVRYAYVDWVVPGADIKVRMGLQPIAQPAYTFNRPIMASSYDVAGITASYQFNDMVGVTLAWTRPLNDDSQPHDSIDTFMLAVPVTGEGWEVTPYVMYGSVGSQALFRAWQSQNPGDPWLSVWGSDVKYLLAGLLPVGAPGSVLAGNTDSGNIWWAGIGGELTMFDPLRVALDFSYGYADLGNIGSWDLKRRGWAASAEVSYTLDFVTPTVRGWYSSGDDANAWDGSERMPSLRSVSTFTNFGYDAWYDSDQIGVGSNGQWGIGLHFDNIQVIENLKHDLRFSYIQGTNNREMAGWAMDYANGNIGTEGLYMTTHDKAWEIDFDTKYDIYKNLAMHVELSYIKLDFDEDTWRGIGDAFLDDDDAYKAGIYLTYKF